MSDNKCFCHLNGFEVKDAKARNNIEKLNNTTSEISEDVTVLENRMNTFTALEEGSTTADSELLDIRVGADGTVYSSAGESVRTQFTNVDDTFIESEIKRIVNVEWLDGYVNAGGTLYPGTDGSAVYSATPIELKAGQTIIVNGLGYQQAIAIISQYHNANSRTPLVYCNYDVTEYTYTATSDIKVTVSALKSPTPKVSIIYKVQENIERVVTEFNNKIDNEVYKKNKLSVEWLDGYVNAGGTLYPGTDGSAVYSATPIELKAGQTIIVNGLGYQQAIAIISQYHNANSRTPLVYCNYDVTEYTYTATSDIKVTVSALKSPLPTVYTFYEIAPAKDDLINYFDVFHKIGGVGDSLMSGEQVYWDSEGQVHFVDLHHYSWLSNIARRNGVDCVHYSSGGQTAKSWYNSNFKNLLENEAEKCSIYFVGLGTNEINHSFTIGTVEDCETDNETFYAYYSKILNTIKTTNPNAKIFCLSPYWIMGDTTIHYANAIQEMAEKYSNCYYVNLLESLTDYSSNTKFIHGGHFTALGYARVGREIETIVNRIVNDNSADFLMFGINNSNI